jgi:flagellar hook-associated protein 2
MTSYTAAGTDAAFSIGGVSMVRDSNSFTIEGVAYTLKSTGTTQVTVEADADALYNKITAFVVKYNDVLDTINGKVSEKRYRDFVPLTEEQRDAMNEDDIARWEEKAKSGLLRDDGILSNITSKLRSAFYDPVYTDSSDASTKLTTTLSSIGITTGTYEQKGKLVIDEAKLKEAITNDPDGIIDLFTNESSVSYTQAMSSNGLATQRYKENGIAQRLYDILQDNIRTTRDTSGNKGILLETAGLIGDASEFKNSIYDQIEDNDDRYNALVKTLTDKETAYYAKFTRMESILSQMNSQSSWIGSQMSK